MVMGITERSGTNYLRDLLLLHPDVCGSDEIYEDFLVANSPLLRRFIEEVRIRWTLNRRIEEVLGNPSRRILQSIGNGLRQLVISTVESEQGNVCRAVVTKTPSVDHISNAPDMFLNSRIIILVRDPAATADSGMKSLGWSFEKAIHGWSSGAEQILSFVDENASAEQRFLVVRFEDLFGDRLEPTLNSVFELCELDPTVYNYAAAERLPVKGSSALGAKGNDQSGWNGVPKPKDFNPLSRGKNWGPLRRARLQHVARRGMDAWGYEIDSPGGAGVFATLLNPILDLAWGIREITRRIYRAMPRNWQRR